MADRKTYSVRVQPDIMKSLKMVAVEREVTVSELLEEAVRDLLKKERSGVKARGK